MEISYKKIKAAAVLYAVFPIIIFFIGWLNIICAVLFTALALAAVYFFLRNMSDDDGRFKSITLTKKQLIIIAVIAFVWCFIAGQGKFVHQAWDHNWRQPTFHDLISHKWPVTYDENTSMLSYYIAQWLLPAVIGKIALAISGSSFIGYLIGNIALLLWSSLGCFLAFLLVSTITNTGNRQRVFIAIFMFIFFSGLDIVGIIITKNPYLLNTSQHIEWWVGDQVAMYRSITTCLFWIYNQTIITWLITLCIINETKIKNLAFLGMLSFPYAPFPFIGLVFFCILKAITLLIDAWKNKTLLVLLKEALSIQNILAIAAIAPVYILFYTSNAAISNSSDGSNMVNVGFRVSDTLRGYIANNDWTGVKDFILTMTKFFLCETAIYMVFLFKRMKPSIELVGMCVSLLIIPYFQIGLAKDFTMDASLPALIYVCICFSQIVQKEIPKWGEYKSLNDCVRHKKFLTAALIVFIIGAVTPFTEMKREFFATITTPYNEIINYQSCESLQNISKDNFVAHDYKDSTFYKLMGKKTTD